MEFQRQTGVSRETVEKLEAYAALLRKWQERINLVSRTTLDDLWRRHFLDSAQLFTLLPENTRVQVDLGSGAGFPGLVLAILGVPEVHLIESDSRKAIFLREAARLTQAPAIVHAERIEKVAPFPADVVSARALASLTELLPLALPFLGQTGVCLFPKGQSWQEELTQAERVWNMRVDRFDSLTDPSATILRIANVVGH
ncbi:MAG TPA: 16S rRNA (guanine(527)-N(7))-methyltransferase RsmG [Azospirillaceae bacterium]|nr:16S rRNA (guanine(527)-N(7))-methyltransferase RsmG [Azospirillaceae bacterium]